MATSALLQMGPITNISTGEVCLCSIFQMWSVGEALGLGIFHGGDGGTHPHPSIYLFIE